MTNTLTTSTNLARTVPRGFTNGPAPGYWYLAVDYAIGSLKVTNATLTLAPGTVLACFGSTGLWLHDNSLLVSEGAPDPAMKIQFVGYPAVQEQSIQWGAAGGLMHLGVYRWTGPAASVRLRWTDFAALSGEWAHFYCDSSPWDVTSFSARDCSFRGSTLYLGGGAATRVALTNNLLERVYTQLSSEIEVFAFNNLFKGGNQVFYERMGSNDWTFRDNAFDAGSVQDWTEEGAHVLHSHNAYLGASGRLYPTNASDVVLTNFVYVSGAFGEYYHGSTNPIDAGSRYATNAQLYFFSTITNSDAFEGVTLVDIGRHLPTTGTNGLALDSDGEGLFDVQEDKNGDGVRDANETDWLAADTDGDGLTDYEEVVLLGLPWTDPLLQDTDGNGTADGEEDFDHDLITTLGEFRWAAAWPLDAFALNRQFNGGTNLIDSHFLCTAPVPGQSTNSRAWLSISNQNNGFWRLTLNGAIAPLVYDVYRSTNLAVSFHLHMRGTWNQTNFDVPDVGTAFYWAGWALDRDGDGLTDGHECIITKTIIDKFDTDQDGMPDGWEVFYGLSPTNSADKTGDSDSDGISNLQEFLNDQQLNRPREPMGPSSRRTPLVISEIMYRPPATGGSEFIEIHNTHHLPQRLDGYTLFNPDVPPSGQAYYRFGSVTIPPGGYLAVVPTNAPSNSLDNGGAKIQLRNALGAVLLEVNYSDDPPWPTEADGVGHSLVLARPSFGEGDPRAWAASEQVGGSRDLAETTTFDPLRAVKINEFLARPVAGNDFIELYNTSSQAVDLAQCGLSENRTNLAQYRFPHGTVLDAHGFLRFYDTNLLFGLSEDGDEIFLSNPATNRVLDAVSFGVQEADVSVGRYPDGAPELRPLAGLGHGDPHQYNRHDQRQCALAAGLLQHPAQAPWQSPGTGH